MKVIYTKIMEGETLTEMAQELGIPQRTAERRIQRAGIKPLTYEAVYPKGTLDRIRGVKMGRPPKKAEDNETGKENKP